MLTLRLVFAKAAVKVTFISRKFFCFVYSPRFGCGSCSQLCFSSEETRGITGMVLLLERYIGSYQMPERLDLAKGYLGQR